MAILAISSRYQIYHNWWAARTEEEKESTCTAICNCGNCDNRYCTLLHDHMGNSAGNRNMARVLESDPEFDAAIQDAADLLPVAARLRYATKMFQLERRLKAELQCIDKEEKETLGNSLVIKGEAKATWAEVIKLRAETRGGRRPDFMKQVTEVLKAKLEIQRATPPGSWRSAQAGDYAQCREETRQKYQAEREALQQKYLRVPKGIEKKLAGRKRPGKTPGGDSPPAYTTALIVGSCTENQLVSTAVEATSSSTPPHCHGSDDD
ncbi:hypothetical protein B0T25DRAFT_568982 [Lasiosphaeria hispida]|uniref:Uncharacterized protein n=1 Tax=Lasiosphaeria hispida TaxID=260671 RepID=A0AAJ0HJD6_9PEZI|nr:hypothetical protein B0T25DRAFT_568982 [Lasiosphaeria hispida]